MGEGDREDTTKLAQRLAPPDKGREQPENDSASNRNTPGTMALQEAFGKETEDKTKWKP